jgi:uncharacterized membrane protein
MYPVWLSLHVLAVAVWVGGMFFAHLCLRPAALQLPPPQRLPLMAETLGRFFAWVIVALLLLWVSGLAMMGSVGMAAAPRSWHLMMGIALLMTVVFAVIRGLRYPRLRAGVAAQDWPAAAAALNSIRLLVLINLVLGVLTIAVATLGRYA